MVKHKHWLWLVGALLIAACTVPVPLVTDQPAPRTLHYGIDPVLPHAKGVLLQSCGEAGCKLHVVDPDTGAALAGYAPIELGKYANYVATPDGKTLAAIVYPSNLFTARGGPTGGVLQLIDLQAWRVMTTTLTFNEGGGAPVFSPDGRSLVLVGLSATWPPTPLLHWVDVTQRREVAQIPLEFRPAHMRFTADGHSILLYGNTMGVGAVDVNAQVYVAQVNALDLTVQWQVVLPAILDGLYNFAGDEPHSNPTSSFTWQPAVVFAPQTAHLYIAHADSDELTVVDFDRHTVRTTAIRPAQSWVERWLALTAQVVKAKVLNGTSKQAVIAPDGKTLYVVGVRGDFTDGVYAETALGIQVIDLSQMVELAHIAHGVRTLRLGADGKHLYLHGWQNDPAQPSLEEWTEIIDATTFQPLAKLEKRAIALGQRLDGRPILLSTVTRQDGQWQAATLDPASLTVIHTWVTDQAEGWGWFMFQ